MRITEDRRIIQALLDKFGHSHAKDAGALIGVRRQSLWNWRERGVPPYYRATVQQLCLQLGIKVDKDWWRPEQRARHKRALERVMKHAALSLTNGVTNGRANPRQSRRQAATRKGQRPREYRAQQRRRAGRGLSALAAQN